MGESTSWPARQLFESAATAGRSLPPAQAERLGRALSEVATPDEAAPVAYLIPSTSFAAAVEHLLTAWRACPTVTGLSVGVAVAAASHAHALARLSSELELVVSGPASETVHARRTEQVLLQLISEARHEILLVTFALEMHEELHEALTGAYSVVSGSPSSPRIRPTTRASAVTPGAPSATSTSSGSGGRLRRGRHAAPPSTPRSSWWTA